MKWIIFVIARYNIVFDQMWNNTKYQSKFSYLLKTKIKNMFLDHLHFQRQQFYKYFIPVQYSRKRHYHGCTNFIRKHYGVYQNISFGQQLLKLKRNVFHKKSIYKPILMSCISCVANVQVTWAGCPTNLCAGISERCQTVAVYTTSSLPMRHKIMFWTKLFMGAMSKILRFSFIYYLNFVCQWLS